MLQVGGDFFEDFLSWRCFSFFLGGGWFAALKIGECEILQQGAEDLDCSAADLWRQSAAFRFVGTTGGHIRQPPVTKRLLRRALVGSLRSLFVAFALVAYHLSPFLADLADK